MDNLNILDIWRALDQQLDGYFRFSTTRVDVLALPEPDALQCVASAHAQAAIVLIKNIEDAATLQQWGSTEDVFLY